MSVNASAEAVAHNNATETVLDLEAVFRDQYARVARVIAGVVGDPARAEELAVDVFLKLWKRLPRGENIQAWLYRAAVRKGVDELRRVNRQSRFERALRIVRGPTPEELHSANEEQQGVRSALAAIGARRAEILLLRQEGLSYGELASALHLNPASVGTLLSRAQDAFRKEYLKRYGNK